MSSNINEVDKIIVDLLEKEKKPLSTYQIAKKTGISWGTVHTHCYKLKDMGMIKGQEKVTRVEKKKKMVWWIE